MKIEGIVNIHDLHVWQLSDTKHILISLFLSSFLFYPCFCIDLFSIIFFDHVYILLLYILELMIQLTSQRWQLPSNRSSINMVYTTLPSNLSILTSLYEYVPPLSRFPHESFFNIHDIFFYYRRYVSHNGVSNPKAVCKMTCEPECQPKMCCESTPLIPR